MLICLENLVMEPQQMKFAKEGNKSFSNYFTKILVNNFLIVFDNFEKKNLIFRFTEYQLSDGTDNIPAENGDHPYSAYPVAMDDSCIPNRRYVI